MNYVVEGFYKFTDEDIEDMVKGLAKEDDEMPLFDFLKPQKSVEPDIFSPTSFDEYIGQNGAKNAAKIMVQAASIENRPIPNILIDGPYGLGKTTLAKLIMDAAGLPVKIIDGSSVKDADISGTLIIDEIHNIPSEICDSLNVKIDQGSLHIIGCTTRLGGLPAPFRSRFRQLHLEPYSVNELELILRDVTARKQTHIDRKFLGQIATRGRNTARTALMMLASIFDYMAVNGESTLSERTLKQVFDTLGVDKRGFLKRDYDYINALHTAARPVGITYLEAVLNLDHHTIEEEIEPYLMREGLVDRTPRGRVLIMPQ